MAIFIESAGGLRRGLPRAAAWLVLLAGIRAQTTTHVTLTSVIPAAPAAGQAVTLKAVISPAVSIGSVAFMDGGVLLGAANVTGGVATVITLTMASGVHSLRAVYSGAGGYSGSQSRTISHVVKAAGGAGFSAAAQMSSGRLPYAVAVGDFNADGIADLAVANSGSNTLTILLGNGEGGFSRAASPATGSVPHSVAVGDFNGDGKADLAVANSASNTVTILLGIGDGRFVPAGKVVTGSSPESVVVGDFNGDGKADLAVANAGSSTVTILQGQGDGTFLAVGSPGVGNIPVSLAVGDFNGDGLADLAVANSGSNTVSILLGRGDGTFLTAPAVDTGSIPRSLAVGDFNGDGRADLAVANSGSRGNGGVTILLGKGDGAFSTSVPLAADAPYSVVAGDFNGDGRVDLAVANTGSNAVSIHLGDGNGSFAAADATIAGSFPSAVVSGDFNRDGRMDLAVANLNSHTVSIVLATAPPSTSLSLTTSLNPSTYGQSITLTATITPGNATGKVEFLDGVTLLGVGTLTAGQAHLATSLLPSGSRSLQARYSGVAGSWSASQSGVVAQAVNPAASSSFLAASSPGVLSTPYAIAVGDFNGDGKPDLILANSANPLILLNNGNATFTQKVDATFSPYNAVAVGDFNGDGKTDVAATNPNNNTVDILLGNGDGTLTLKSSPGTGVGAGSIAVGDFNADGIADLAVANGDGTVTILLGNGDGTFAAAPPLNVGGVPSAIAIGDFNGDGKTDLVVADVLDGIVSILLGNGNGTFSAGATPTVGASPSSIVVGDFNGDGKADLAVANSDTTISILLGNGDGTFLSAASPAAPAGTAALVAADFNGDGKADLAVVGSDGGGAFSILLGNGDGTFIAGATPPTGSFPLALAVADFNGDGRADLAVVNNSSVTVGIVLGEPAALSITKTHTGNFLQGQQGATFTVTVSNAARAQATNGIITVTEVPPGNLTLVSMAGTGWACVTASKTCTRSDPLAGGASYPSITVTVNVSTTAVSPINQVKVSGGASATDSVVDQAFVYASALSITKTHTGSFMQGQQGATYTLTVSNAAAGKATSSAVTVTETVPVGLTLVSMSGTGWTCGGGTTCTRSDALAAGISYPSITVTVNVAPNAAALVTNQAGVSGGGSGSAAVSDPTAILGSPCDVNGDGSTNVLDVQQVLNESLGTAPAMHDLDKNGVVNVVDIQRVINAALGQICWVS